MTAIPKKTMHARGYRRMHVPICLDAPAIVPAPTLSEHQTQTAFLRHCLLYDDTTENRQLMKKIEQVQQDERSVRRAFWLMLLLGTFAAVGLCYSAIFLTDYPTNMFRFMNRFFTQLFCVLGLISIICLPVFACLGFVYRKKLDLQREQCRRRVIQIMESRLGKPVTAANAV